MPYNFNNSAKFCLHTFKWIHELRCNANNSVQYKSLVRIHVNDSEYPNQIQIILLKLIYLRIVKWFQVQQMIKQFYLTHRWDPERLYTIQG